MLTREPLGIQPQPLDVREYLIQPIAPGQKPSRKLIRVPQDQPRRLPSRFLRAIGQPQPDRQTGKFAPISASRQIASRKTIDHADASQFAQLARVASRQIGPTAIKILQPNPRVANRQAKNPVNELTGNPFQPIKLRCLKLG